ncbi:hypothetical protein PYW07_006663 [Mythimna separata]|uniref:Uncharacterized protein n=1 Tax=Mythimna separata TaxID=271217 RepID=A0AAD7YU12_MYTSE|nr:hypothetical protein PYW07_006663 [Mythimna separata]
MSINENALCRPSVRDGSAGERGAGHAALRRQQSQHTSTPISQCSAPDPIYLDPQPMDEEWLDEDTFELPPSASTQPEFPSSTETQSASAPSSLTQPTLPLIPNKVCGTYWSPLLPRAVLTLTKESEPIEFFELFFSEDVIGFVECGMGSAPASPMERLAPPPSCLSRPLREDDMAFLVNCVSDDDSEDDEEETNGVVPVIIPRAYQSLLETPLDLEDAVGDPPAADSVPAESPSDVEDVPSSTTHLPRELFNFDWREFPLTPIRPELRRETFSESNVGPTTPCADP